MPDEVRIPPSSDDGMALPAAGSSIGVERRIRPPRRSWLLTAALLLGDAACGAVALVGVSLLAWLFGTASFSSLRDTLIDEVPAILLLLVGVSVLLGVYGNGTSSQLERFRRRTTAILTFVFAGTLLSMRANTVVALGIVPLAGLVALVLGTWLDLFLRSAFWKSNAGAPTAILGAGAKS